MGRIWESINASNQHMLTHVPNGQIAGSPLCGRGLKSQTSHIKEYDFLMKNGLHVTLVDTPGFNAYTADAVVKSDLVILKELGAFLKAK